MKNNGNFWRLPTRTQARSQSPSSQNDPWERKVLQDLAFAAIKEQRATRRWGYLFKFLVLLYFVAIFLMTRPFGEANLPSGAHTALVDVNGVIAPDMEASADRVVTGIREAFESPQAKALIIRMNTPGGSPVQSGVINDEITRLRATRPDFPVYAVIRMSVPLVVIILRSRPMKFMPIRPVLSAQLGSGWTALVSLKQWTWSV